jgi:thioesterase domain-containing protein
VTDLRGAGVEGPCVLGGGCAAGIIAFEMARQMRAQGQAVPLVVMFDVDYPLPRVVPYRLGLSLLRLPRVLHRLRRLRGRERSAYALELLRTWARRVASWVGPGGPGAGGGDAVERLRAYLKHEAEPQRAAAWRHRPGPFGGRLALVLSRDTGVWFGRDRRLDWRRLARDGCEVHAVPGDHNQALEEPHVQAVAEVLRGCIDRAARRGP